MDLGCFYNTAACKCNLPVDMGSLASSEYSFLWIYKVGLLDHVAAPFKFFKRNLTLFLYNGFLNCSSQTVLIQEACATRLNCNDGEADIWFLIFLKMVNQY